MVQAVFPEPEKLFQASCRELEGILAPGQYRRLLEARNRTADLEGMKKEYEEVVTKGIFFVGIHEKEYPERLREIPDAPMGLYYRGKLPEEGIPAVAIIGSRDCSEYGKNVAAELGRFLGERGIDVISGMARGIDGISQQAALKAGGASYGVLGSGVDVCYPASNQGLYDTLLEKGGILSTYPPGTQPVSRNFPPRNRIVSGLADALVVVEARLKSGTLITVDMALEQGKDVYVVPGRVTDRLSDGCNKLLKQGAGVYTDPESFLEELEENCFLKKIAPVNSKKSAVKKENIPEDLIAVWNCLDETPKSVEEIGRLLGGSCSVTQLGVQLMRLSMEGRARQVTAGFFCRIMQ